jgi:hypothetical protein
VASLCKPLQPSESNTGVPCSGDLRPGALRCPESGQRISCSRDRLIASIQLFAEGSTSDGNRLFANRSRGYVSTRRASTPPAAVVLYVAGDGFPVPQTGTSAASRTRHANLRDRKPGQPMPLHRLTYEGGPVHRANRCFTDNESPSASGEAGSAATCFSRSVIAGDSNASTSGRLRSKPFTTSRSAAVADPISRRVEPRNRNGHLR